VGLVPALLVYPPVSFTGSATCIIRTDVHLNTAKAFKDCQLGGPTTKDLEYTA